MRMILNLRAKPFPYASPTAPITTLERNGWIAGGRGGREGREGREDKDHQSREGAKREGCLQ